MTTTTHSSDKIWNNPKFRATFFQVFILAFIIVAAWMLFTTTTHNLQSRGITSGFGFLKRAAGFEIPFTMLPFDSSDSNGRVFWVGLLNTLIVSFLGIILATTIGVIIGIARLSKNWIVARIATVYIETFRNIPLLLQIFFWYFAVLGALSPMRQAMKNGLFNDTVFLSNRGFTIPKPVFEPMAIAILIVFIIALIATFFYRRYAIRKQEQTGLQLPVLRVAAALIIGLPLLTAFLTGLPISLDYPEAGRFNFVGGMTIIPEFLALLFALSIYTGAFIAEIVRSGINSVSHGQTEAAYSLAIKPSYTLRLVIIPQALRVIIPPLASQYLNLAKNSSLAAAIAYPELVSVFTGTVLNNSGQALECVAITMIAYLSISLSIAAFMNWYNKRIELVER
ncbi:MAG: amino acid ABC transporter permease [Gammaproteobacteria bacterium]|nr:MAG: amino acid ABC transporter permease [Gammaproteobacteria bacterium]